MLMTVQILKSAWKVNRDGARRVRGLVTSVLRISRYLTVFAICGFTPALTAETQYFKTPESLDTTGFQETFARIGPGLYIAGQPSEEGLRRAKALGVTRVINLRTDFEMNNRDVVPFDEAALVGQLDMDYVHIPLGGPQTPYSPAAVDQFAQAIAQKEPVLLHCTVAWRATHLWTAYLIDKQGLAFEEAVRIGRQLNLGGLPLEGFLGRPLTITPAARDDDG